jgi:DNA-binding response OmpR family regulator
VTPPRVLVVDDDPTVAEVVSDYLGRAGLDVVQADDAASALAAAAATPPDLALLDLMLPDADGLELLARLRERQPGLPVVLLTARGEEPDRILGLSLGADDYVAKPFSPRELVLRVQALLRRSAPQASTGLLRDGDLVVDLAGHEATRDGEGLSLTSREFDLLAFLVAHPGVAYTREELMREVWGWEFGDQSTVTVHVRRVRAKVERDPAAPTRLVTVFGVGYRWDPE